jgi:hypothetical protein
VSGDQSTPPDRVQAALDASCAALLALEQARDAMSSADGDLARSMQAELEAMELVRAAIRDLRRATPLGPPSALALGFVQPGSQAQHESATSPEPQPTASPQGR